MPSWDSPETSKIDDVIYALQDKNIDLKRVTQAINETGAEIDDRWDAYLQEELFHGRSAKRTQEFIKNELEPLIEEMRMRGVTMQDFEHYLWARHAEERNEQIAKINPDMPDGGSGITTQEARDYLSSLDPQKRKHYEALAKRVDAITHKTRQTLVDARSSGAQGGKFYNNITRMNTHQREIMGRLQAGEDIEKYLKDNPEAELFQHADRVYGAVQKMRKHKRMMQAAGASRDEIAQIESEITELMASFNEEVRKLNER